MWMMYSEQSWPKAIDKISSIKRLKEELCALERDAVNEKNRISSYYSQEYLEELENRYSLGAEICTEYLEKKNLCDKCFITRLVNAGLKDFTNEVEKFMEREDGLDPNEELVEDAYDVIDG